MRVLHGSTGFKAPIQLIVLLVGVVLGIVGWGYVGAVPASELHPRITIRHQEKRVAGMTIVRPDCTQKPCLALTFDDGPDPVLTPHILDTLDRHKAHATFFVLGSRVHGNEALLKRMHVSGHEIGNHSWSHHDLTAMPVEQLRDEVYGTQAAVAKAGVPAPRLFRPPYGVMNEVVRSQVPLTIVQWNIDPEDWQEHKPMQQIVDHMGAYAKPGGVVVMHDTEARTLEALEPMLINMGQIYQFVTVSELLALAPGQPGVYYGR